MQDLAFLHRLNHRQFGFQIDNPEVSKVAVCSNDTSANKSPDSITF